MSTDHAPRATTREFPAPPDTVAPPLFVDSTEFVLWYGKVIPISGDPDVETWDAWQLNVELNPDAGEPWAPNTVLPHHPDRAKDWASAWIATNTNLIIADWRADPWVAEPLRFVTRPTHRRVHRLQITTPGDILLFTVDPPTRKRVLAQLADPSVALLTFPTSVDSDAIMASAFLANPPVATWHHIRVAQIVDVRDDMLHVPFEAGDQ